MPFHDRQMKRVSRRQTRIPQDDSLRPFKIGQLDRKDFVGDSENRVEGGLDRVAPADGDIPVENLLEHFRVRDEPLFQGNEFLQKLLGVPFVRMRRPDQIHRDVRIEEDHCGGESR